MDMSNRSVFACRLRFLRKSRHMTQEDVAQWLNIHRTTYTKYETDKANPDQACLIELARLFRVSTDYLLGKEAGSDLLSAGSVRDEGGHDMVLSDEEIALLQQFRRLSREQRRTVLQNMIGQEGSNKKKMD